MLTYSLQFLVIQSCNFSHVNLRRMIWLLFAVSYFSLLTLSFLFNKRRRRLGVYLHYILYYVPNALLLIVYSLVVVCLYLVNIILTSRLFFRQMRLEDCPIGEENKISSILSPVDLSFQFDDDKFLSADGLFILKGEFSFDKFKSEVLNNFAFAKDKDGRILYPKLTQVVKDKAFFSIWEYFPNFNVDNHVNEEWLDLSSSNELQTFLNAMLSVRIPANQPGFQFTVIRDKNPSEHPEQTETYVLYRLDHTMGDGLTFVRIFMNSLGKPLTENDSSKLSEMFQKYSKSQFQLTAGKLLLLALLSPIYLCDLLHLDPRGFFRRNVTGRKCVTYSPPLDFTKISAIKNKTKTTVNDVFLMLLGQTLQSYMQEMGEDAAKFDFISVLQAISLKMSLSDSMSNNFVGVRIRIPLDILSWREMLNDIHADMLSLKFSLIPIFNTFSVSSLAYFPKQIRIGCQTLLFDHVITCGFTNIPGPDINMTLAGVPIDHFAVFVPLFGNTSFSSGFISFRKKVCISFITDEALCANPNRLVNHFVRNLDYIYHEVSQI